MSRRVSVSFRPTNLRAGALLLAIGLGAGSLFGPTLATAADNFKDVLVVNTATEPVPVTGAVNVGNLPATQPVSGTVDVGNLPATQTVSGTVDVGSLPTPAPISEGATQSGSIAPGTSSSVEFGGLDRKVVAVTFWSDRLTRMIIDSDSGAITNGYQLVNSGDQTIVQSFTNPLPAKTVTVWCQDSTPCTFYWTVAGI